MKHYRFFILILTLMLLLSFAACGGEEESAAAPEPATIAPPDLLNRQIVVLHDGNAQELPVDRLDVPFVPDGLTQVFYMGTLDADGRPEGEGTLAWNLNREVSYALYCENFQAGRLAGKFRYVSFKSAADAAETAEREYIDGEMLASGELEERFGGPVWHGDFEAEETLGGMTMRYTHATGDFAGGELREGSEVAMVSADGNLTHRYRQVFWRDEQADEQLEVARRLYGADC